MQIYQHSQIGTFHADHNEDHLCHYPIASHQTLLAVMDGCSMGTESHFASTLFAKLLKKISKGLFYQEFATGQQKSNHELIELVLQQLFTQVHQLKHQLSLEVEELLCTLMLAIIDQDNRSAVIHTIGDGVLVFNGKIKEYDQDNKPDYLAYHLDQDFEKWFAQHQQKDTFHQLNDLSIISDGIFTFRSFDNNIYKPISEVDLMQQLIHDLPQHPYFLKQKLLEIEQQYGLKPSDDLSIIRVTWF